MNCILTNTKEFQDLLKETGLPSLMLEMKISKWQMDNGVENFPGVKELNEFISNPIKSFSGEEITSQSEFKRIMNSASPLNKVAKILFNYGKGLETRIINSDLYDKGASGLTYTFFNTDKFVLETDVAIDLKSIKNLLKYRPDRQDFYEEVVLHEEIHRYTVTLFNFKDALVDKTDWQTQMLDMGFEKNEVTFIEEIEELYAQYLENKSNNPEFSQPDSDIKEFVTYGLTNSEFMKELDKIKVKNVSILKRIINSLFKLFKNDITIKQALENSFESFMSNEQILKDYIVQVDYHKGVEKGKLSFMQNNTTQTTEQYVASEKTIRDLAARMSDRIGIPVRFESDRTKDYRGKLENGTAVVNLAHATLDTPIHEILGHPIIRTIKNGKELTNFKYTIKNISNDKSAPGKFQLEYYSEETLGDIDFFETREEAEQYVKNLKVYKGNNQLYQNLLKELEYGKGKEVLDRIKRDYQYKDVSKREVIYAESQEEVNNLIKQGYEYSGTTEDGLPEYTRIPKYTLEEQQEEAIVELLGLYTADRLDKVKDGKLISLLKRLLKEMKVFVKQLLGQKEVEIDKLPDNMTLGDIADLLAYSNSKLILPGNEVIYTTPDNQQFKTYAEASKHISDLAKRVEDVDLSNVNLENIIPNSFTVGEYYISKQGNKYIVQDEEQNIIDTIDILEAKKLYKESYEYQSSITKIESGILSDNNIKSFIEKNKEYEQSKEIIEEWKKVNNIQYNPEEIYSRGQEFSSVVGAYSSFDVKLMMQNLLQHIEDNQKAGGEFTISAFTKPVDKKIGHLEGGGGKIKFKIYPQSKDIKWAANTDVYSGSVWDASEKISRDKKSELLGVSYTKYPALQNINSVQPNLASIIDNLAHHHNELGISLTGSNFRLEYDEDIPYSTKKIIDSINSILNQKYGKLVKPEIKKQDNNKEYYQVIDETNGTVFKTFTDKIKAAEWLDTESEKQGYPIPAVVITKKDIGIQPTQTNETLKESIESVKNKIAKLSDGTLLDKEEFTEVTEKEYVEAINKGKKRNRSIGTKEFGYSETYEYNGYLYTQIDSEQSGKIKIEEKEYTSQALINTKIAALKEVAKKYPRSLIRSEVKPIKTTITSLRGRVFEMAAEDELPFQKVSKDTKPITERNQEIEDKLVTFLNTYGISVEFVNSLKERGYDAIGIADITNKLVLISKGEASVDTLPEEAAHFAVELLGNENPLVKRLMSIVESTELYNEVMEEYKGDASYQNEDGSVNVEKIKKEAIGKAIAERIVKGSAAKVDSSFMNTLRMLWNKVLGMFKKVDLKALNKEFESITGTIGKQMLDNTLEGKESNLFSSKIGKLKSKSSREVGRAKQAIKTLETRIKQVKNRPGEIETDLAETAIAKIQSSIASNEAIVGLEAYIDLIETSLLAVDRQISKYRAGELNIVNNLGDLKYIHEFTDLHESMLSSIYEMFEEDVYLRERAPALLESTQAALQSLGVARNFLNSNIKEATVETVNNYSTKEMTKEELFEEPEKDISSVSLWLNTYKNSKNEVVRIVNKLLKDIRNNVARYTINLGKDIVALQIAAERTGFKDFSKLAERNKAGELTGNIIREYNYGDYYAEKAKVNAKIEEIFEKPLKDVFSSELSNEAWRVINELYGEFHKKNSQTVNGLKVPNNSYKSKVYAELMKNAAVKAYYDKLIDVKKTETKKLPKAYQGEWNIFRLPQIRKNTIQRIMTEDSSIFRNIGKTLSEDVKEAFKVREDDTEFGHKGGEILMNPITKKEIKYIPVHYNSKLSDLNDLSLDFSATYIQYANMAEMYAEKNRKANEIWLIEEAIKKKPMIQGNKIRQEGSNAEKVLTNLVDTHFYGREKELQILKYKGVISGKNREVNLTKIGDRFNKYVRNNNLMFNVFTHVSNYVMSGAYSKIEDIAGRYSTNESKLRAEKEFDLNIHNLLGDTGKRLKTNKISLMMELNSIVTDPAKMFGNLNLKSGVGRFIANSGWLSTYEIADVRVKAKMMISMYDNHRLVDGKFINFKEFKTLNKGLTNSEINKKWKELSDKTLYDAYEVKGNKLVVKPEYEKYVNNNLLNKMTGTLEHVLNNIDGQLSAHDKTELHRNILGRMILTHRNWMITGLEDRFKTNKYNYITEEMEEGNYRTFGRLMLSGFKRNEEGQLDIKHILNEFKSLIILGDKLSPEEKANVKKVYADMVFVFSAMIIASILNGIADDEPDDYLAQFSAFMGSRIKMEAIALAPFTVHSYFQGLDIIKSPAAGINQFESIINAFYMFTYEDEEGKLKAFTKVKSGGYKGKTKIEQTLIKRSPIKNFWELNIESIKGKNKYVTNMGLK